MDGQQFPIGLGLSLAMNQMDTDNFSNMTEAEKEQAIARCKDAKSKKERDRIMDSLAGEYDILSSLYGSDTEIG